MTGSGSDDGFGQMCVCGGGKGGGKSGGWGGRLVLGVVLKIKGWK